MKSIPRFVAGTAVVLAAILTTAPLTAGIADYVLNPSDHSGKRAAAHAGQWRNTTEAEMPADISARTAERPNTADRAETTNPNDETDARLAELATDLQAGVEAGEYTQADAARVLNDMASYIRGERTFPERGIA